MMVVTVLTIYGVCVVWYMGFLFYGFWFLVSACVLSYVTHGVWYADEYGMGDMGDDVVFFTCGLFILGLP